MRTELLEGVLVLLLAAWPMTARTVTVGVPVGVLLTTCAVVIFGLAKEWFLADLKYTLIMTLILVMVAAIWIGAAIEERLIDTPERLAATTRTAIGMVMSILAGTVGLGGVALFLLLNLINGNSPAVPTTAGVLPLPAGLVVESDVNQGCGGGTTTFCTRLLTVRSTTKLSSAQIVQLLTAGVNKNADWDSDECRNEGYLLDRSNVCIDIEPAGDEATIQIQSSYGS